MMPITSSVALAMAAFCVVISHSCSSVKNLP